MPKESFFITKEFDRYVVMTVLHRFWWIPLLTLSVSIVTAFFYLRYTMPVYESGAIIQLETTDKAKELLNVENLNDVESNFNSNIELMKSQLIFEEAIQKLNINVSLFQKGNVLTEEKYLSSLFIVQPYELRDSNLVNVPINLVFEKPYDKVELNYNFGGKEWRYSRKIGEHIKTKHFDIVVKIPSINALEKIDSGDEFFFTFNSVKSLSSKFLPNLSVVPLDRSAKTVMVRFAGFQPVFCKDIVFSVINSFFAYDLKTKKKGSENILKFIDVQLDSLSVELKASKDNLMDFQRSSKLMNPEDATPTGLSSEIEEIQDEILLIDSEQESLRVMLDKINKDPKRLDVYRLLPEMLGKSYENSVSPLIQDLQDLLEKKEDLLFLVTEENPEIASINLKVDTKIETIRKSVAIIQNRLSNQRSILYQKLGEIQSKLFDIPEKKLEYNRLKNIQDLNEKYFTLLTEKKVIYAISDAGFSSKNRILAKPEVVFTPIAPNAQMIYSGFVGMGFALGLMFLFIKYVRFNEINFIDDLKGILPEKVSYVGTVPLLKDAMEFSELIVHEKPKSIITESFRTIRTNFNFISNNYKTVAISSSISGEGKTFVALNSAAVIAMSGKKTILIDLDLRKPKVHLAMRTDNSVGMSNAISKDKKWQDCTYNSDVPNLDFISAGPIPPNPSELILSDDFNQIIEEMKEVYDVIVMDNPPVGVVSDGVAVLAKADIPVYVFKSQYSKRIFANRVKELMDIQQVSKLCIVLNGVQAVKRGYGYAYSYGYSYGYGYGYGYGGYFSDEAPEKKSILQRIFKRK